MERKTVLILDSQLHRGGILEQGLNSRGFNVFRTSRGREAAKLMQVLQPDILILAWEGEGIKFYQDRVGNDPTSSIRCVLMGSGVIREQRPVDSMVDMELSANALIDAVADQIQAMSSGQVDTPPINQMAGVNMSTPQAHGSPFSTQATQRATPAPKPSFPLTPLPLARNPASLTPSPATSPPQGGTEAYPAFAGTPNRKREWRGSLDKLDIARLFSILMRRQASGQLTLTLQGEARSIWLQGGTLHDATTNLPLLQLPELLVQENVITHEHAQQHPELARPRPGAHLLTLGLIRPDQVNEYDRLYVEQVVEACFLWEFGTFTFTPDENAFPQSGTELPPLIIRGVREGYSRERLIQLLGGEDRIPQWFAQRSPEHFLPMNTMEKGVIDQIDGVRSLRELWVSLELDPRVPYGLVYVLMILGYVTLQESSSARPARSGDVYATSTSSQVRQQAGDVTPQVALSSARDMYKPATQAPTPHSMPSLPTNKDGTPSRAPSVSYRVMANNRAPARPVLKTALDLTPMSIAPEAQPASTQDEAAIQTVETKHRSILAEDYFEILEIEANAGDMEIRRAYQRLKHSFSSQQLRAGLHQSATAQLEEIQQTIQEAYDVLGDPTLRELYRQNLDAP